MAWQKFTVEIKGEGEPIEVQTNALDWQKVQLDPKAPMDGMWQAIHRALVRTGAPVPKDYPGFLEVLDSMPELADDETLDPTTEGP